MQKNDKQRKSIFSRINFPQVIITLILGALISFCIALSISAERDIILISLSGINAVLAFSFLIFMYKLEVKLLEESKDKLESIYEMSKENLESISEESKEKLESIYEELSKQHKLYHIGHPYHNRLSHFPVEKEQLADFTVKNVLPRVVENILDGENDAEQINIILDAGTTITPIFKKIMKFGIAFEKPSNSKFENTGLKFLTNNLAGIDHVQYLKDYDDSKFAEGDFFIISGYPKRKYMSILGEPAIKFLEEVKKIKKLKPNSIFNIGVVTANWLTAGRHPDKINLSLAAGGVDHMQFKKKIIDTADIILIIAPLGKILRIDTTDKLEEKIRKYNNKINETNSSGNIAERKYELFSIPEDKKDSTYLITTFRNDTSPFKLYSENFLKIKEKKSTENFTFWNNDFFFNPRGSIQDIILQELPHNYVRDSFSDFYLYKSSISLE